MTAFDYIVLSVLILSCALGIWRGIIREVFALGAWIVAIVCTMLFGQWLTNALPMGTTPIWLKALTGYALVFVGVFIAISVIGFIFTKVIASVGLSFVDRALGGAFGVLRGGLIVVLLVLFGGAAGLSQSEWWQQSASAKPFETLAAILRNKFPNELAAKLKFAHHADAVFADQAKEVFAHQANAVKGFSSCAA
jgi:membrane protein required for colicin V production